MDQLSSFRRVLPRRQRDVLIMAGMTIFFCWLGGGPSSEMLFIASPKSRLSATSGLSFTSTFHIHIHVGMPGPFCSFPWRTRTRTCPRFGRHASHHFFYWFALRVDTREAPFHRPQISIESSIAPRTFNLASAKEKKPANKRDLLDLDMFAVCKIMLNIRRAWHRLYHAK